jgi:hypothetical protein
MAEFGRLDEQSSSSMDGLAPLDSPAAIPMQPV